MPLITRTIDNTGSPLVDVNGAVLASTLIRFTLVNERSYAAGTFDATTGEPVAPGPYLATTDDNGLFNVDLWPTSRGLEERFYLTEIAPDSDSVEFPPFKAPLVDGMVSLPFLAFRLGGDAVTAWEMDAFTAHVNNMALHTPTGTGHTHDNKAVLDQFGESAGQPTYNGAAITGQAGADGSDGLPGADGADGVGVASFTVNVSGHLIVTLTDTTVIDAGYVVGPAGANGADGSDGLPGADGLPGGDGADGISITGVAIDGSNHLIVTLSDSSIIYAGALPGGSGTGDMLKSTYDPDGDGVIAFAQLAGVAAALGTDDNYVTDAEKAKLANLSGTNTGDQDLSGLQPLLVSGTSIKSINNESLLGSGNITITAESGATDHGDLTGLSDDDHTHYLNNARGDARYDAIGAASSAVDGHISAADPHTQYAETSALSGLLNESAHDALDHTGLTGIPTAYSLPTASTTVLGGVKVDGTTVLISDGIISSGGSGSLLVAETVVSGSAVTSVTFSGLDGNASGGYVLVADICSANAANACLIKMHVNTETTDSNYTVQVLDVYNTTPSYPKYAYPSVAWVGADYASHATISMQTISGSFAFISLCNGRTFTAVDALNYYGQCLTSITNITALTLSAAGQYIDIGSAFRLYKRK